MLAVAREEGLLMHSLRWWLAVVFLGAGLACAADTKKDEEKLSDKEERILELTNEARAKEKLPPLKVNATLLKVARAHSGNMAKQHALEHKLDGKTPSDRVDQAGYNYRTMGENIAAGPKAAPVEKIFKGWMESKEHREHILSPKFDEIGLGHATDDKDEVYYTQVFGKQRGER
jgi:uncharacterized protein YkwD